MHIIRVLRGIVTPAATSAAVWVPCSLISMGLASLLGSPLPDGVLRPLLIGQTVMGALNGAVFASGAGFATATLAVARRAPALPSARGAPIPVIDAGTA